MKVRAIDLFCGAGGSSWGAQSAGVEIVAGFDCWKLGLQVFKDNFPDARLYPNRLEDIQPGDIVEELGNVDLILASPECTNHSPAKGNGERSEASKETAFHVTRFASILKPRWIVIENVVMMRHWSRYIEFKNGLARLGYFVTEEILDAVDFGVPQSRRRLFLLCDRERKPSQTSRKGLKEKLCARDFISLNGDYEWNLLVTKDRAKATLKRAKKARAAVGLGKPFLLVYYGDDYRGWQRLTKPLRTVTTLDRFAVVKRKKRRYRMRMLQVPELQVAMGMSDMKFNHGTRRDRIRMLGNAVCPPVMAEILKTLTAAEASD